MRRLASCIFCAILRRRPMTGIASSSLALGVARPAAGAAPPSHRAACRVGVEVLVRDAPGRCRCRARSAARCRGPSARRRTAGEARGRSPAGARRADRRGAAWTAVARCRGARERSRRGGGVAVAARAGAASRSDADRRSAGAARAWRRSLPSLRSRPAPPSRCPRPRPRAGSARCRPPARRRPCRRARRTVPATGDGISTVALSVITSASVWSSTTVSPSFTCQATSSTSAMPSPMSGSLMT